MSNSFTMTDDFVNIFNIFLNKKTFWWNDKKGAWYRFWQGFLFVFFNVKSSSRPVICTMQPRWSTLLYQIGAEASSSADRRRLFVMDVFSLLEEHSSLGRQNEIKILPIFVLQQVSATLPMFAKKRAPKAKSVNLLFIKNEKNFALTWMPKFLSNIWLSSKRNKSNILKSWLP